MFSKVFFVFSAAAAVLLSAGCASQVEEIPENYGHIKFKRPEKVVYEQISALGMNLSAPKEVHAVAGTKHTIDLQLINRSKRKVVIKEWYMLDHYNFSIFYRKMPADRPLDSSVPFKEYTVRIPLKPLPQHAELQLMPNNRAVLTIDLPFVGELNPGENAAFETYVATSLKTFKIKSNTFMVYAR